ncbi:asparagine synthetase B [Sporosarcina sp. E16_3]|uniref:asparagine synthase-related protein n=1 Tax=Sporosarcina sp. E16_3 TaxID=2789293 RepID=UPI001A922A76|nr:asparagine synthase-related protein [Sporosarcina sp. E16_3]MBO0602528.1 asparagine synthetase B [Sporosarcina sp. E16_3]
MSAIAGIYHLNGEPINIQHGRDLMKALQKYPADAVQTWHLDSIFLGCHAQWITPESVGEQLPFYDYERQCAITADAIIDNRKDLFERLQIESSLQKHITDSELILRAYYKWNEEAPKFLVGDFAFMIWDQKQQRLFGARDFSGSRTLYYQKSHDKFAFCTIIEPLMTLPFIEKKLNEQWLAEYLAITGPGDGVDSSITPYLHIGQVPPSHSILVEKNKVTLNRHSYVTKGKTLKLKSNEEYVEAFQHVFQEAVTTRLRTHKEVGSQLSGGLDSGAVVGFAAKELQKENKRLHTFSYIPPGDFKDFTPNYLMANESPHIKSTVDYVGGITDHYCDFKGKDPYSEIDPFLDILEKPYKFFPNSFWLKGMFEKAQEANVGVLLNGDRGNFTVSWGPALDYYSVLLKRFKWIKLHQELLAFRNNMGGSRLRYLKIISRKGFPLIDRLFPGDPPDEVPALINPIFAKKTGVYSTFEKYGIDHTGWYAKADIFTERKKYFEDVFQLNGSGILASKLSLQYALWKRDPTNDLRIVKFCLALPESQYVQHGVDRSLIRRATKNYLPDQVRLNQRIRGVQGADWVHRMIPHWDAFREEVQQLRTDQRILEYIDGQALQGALTKLEQQPVVEDYTNPDYTFLMQALIVYRFLKRFD